MHNYLQEYIAYYRLRMQRYENNPAYKNSYESAKAMYEAMASCATIDEFKDKLGNLHHMNAVALIKDEYAIRLKHYQEMNETVKAKGIQEILDRAGDINDVAELITMVNGLLNKNSIAINADSIAPFDDPGYLERWEIWSTAEVPAQYKTTYQQYADGERKDLLDAYQAHEKAMQNFVPGWKHVLELAKEERHRRLLPYPDDVIDSAITQTQSFLNNAGR